VNVKDYLLLIIHTFVVIFYFFLFFIYQAFGITSHEELHGDTFMEEFVGYGLAVLGGNCSIN
jgi:hypothetical protein